MKKNLIGKLLVLIQKTISQKLKVVIMKAENPVVKENPEIFEEKKHVNNEISDEQRKKFEAMGYKPTKNLVFY